MIHSPRFESIIKITRNVLTGNVKYARWPITRTIKANFARGIYTG